MNRHNTKEALRHSSFIMALMALLAWCGTTHAQVEEGKAYRIVSVAAPTKSLLTQNSSLDYHSDSKPAQVMLWTETDVASQQWAFSGEETSLIIRNVYSNRPMAGASATEGAQVRQARSGAVRWILEAVDEATGIYKIKNNTKDLYLTTTATTDGTVVELAAANNDKKQQWRFVEVEPKNTFTREMREEMMDAYVKSAVETIGTNRKTFGRGGWGEAEQLEVVLDA